MTEDGTPFDIHQELSDESELLEEQAEIYREQLLERFVASPEAQSGGEEDELVDAFWVEVLLDYGMRYLGVTPPQMTPDEMHELLYEVFPAKVSAVEFDAEEAFRALRAFWQYLKREYALDNADACLNALNERALRRFEREMNDPRNYGMAKSMVMTGAARGFDMTTEDGINQWMATHQQEMLEGRGTPIPLPGETGREADFARSKMRSANRKVKIKRKQAKASRKKNRKKKK
ncbi:MAG: hypothetical protein K8S97_14945 [Anaerolineae bacterium]|nr:hypothetical protein [Anaerolineae bacterium]